MWKVNISTGCPKKRGISEWYSVYFFDHLLTLLINCYQFLIYLKNWDLYVHAKYKTISEQYREAEKYIFYYLICVFRAFNCTVGNNCVILGILLILCLYHIFIIHFIFNCYIHWFCYDGRQLETCKYLKSNWIFENF